MSVLTGQAKVTIATSTTVSSALDCDGMIVTGIACPAALTSTALTFQVACEPTIGSVGDPVPVFRQLTDATGAAVTVTVAAAKHVALSPLVFAGFRQIKVVCGTAEEADRLLTVVMRPEL